jgi:hypothetical protein
MYVPHLPDALRTKKRTQMNYRIIKTKCGKYFIQQKLLWFWMIVRPSGGPTFMDSLYHAQLALREIKRYRDAKHEIVWEE